MTEKFSNLSVEEPREINLDEVDANLEKARLEREIGVVADQLIDESAVDLHQRQMCL